MDQTSIEAIDPDDLTIELMGDPQPGDPYPLYHALREAAPNHPSMLGVRFVSSYAGCIELMRSADFGQSFGFGSEEYGDSAFIKMVGEMLILTNPPQHTRLRRLVSIAFSPRMIERQIPKIQGNVDTLLDQMAAKGGGDLVAEFANPIPAMMLCDLLGAHFEDQPKIQGWSDAVADAVKPVLDEEVLRRADEATLAFHGYIRDLVAERKADPGEDLISALCAVEEEGDRITETELVNVLFTIMAAGSETTTSLIASGTMLIGSHPDERA
ncbi:MAG TPA: cytochrome P450, partial [Acidimicrobiia bacterium]